MSRDFDFLFGSWTVKHRRLKHRLAGSSEWEEFDGTCMAHPLLDGQANIDDNVLDAPSGTCRAASLRAFDPKTGKWSIWWLDGRTPSTIDTPVLGNFCDGVGTFYANDTYEGKPVVVRFLWSDIGTQSAKWQQAFSADDGETWETNWIMLFQRAVV